ncbi:MAG: MmcQ/YjbR family DNA-binding protein [Gammaproteobacteria bacterium]|nr:MmcQ/YjbR family DNA-binding protein [Gammaproteobacteria bacterium]
MDAQAAKAHFLARPDAWLDYPFGVDVCVFKVKDKMFGTLGWEGDLARINLKCDPPQAAMLRDIFASVLPGYHMNKLHWNTVLLDASIPVGEIQRMIELSYALVVKKLKRASRLSLEVKFGKQALYGQALGLD